MCFFDGILQAFGQGDRPRPFGLSESLQFLELFFVELMEVPDDSKSDHKEQD